MSEAGNRRVLRARPEVVHAQSRKYAQVALEHYNQTNKSIKLELVDAMPVNCMREDGYFYAHVNFTARPGEEEEEGSSEQEQQLFFAELQLCGRRRAPPSGCLVTCCEPLGPDKTAGHRGVSPDGGSAARNDVDITRCFACSSRMLHPKGDKYVAGHCNVPYFYTTP